MYNTRIVKKGSQDKRKTAVTKNRIFAAFNPDERFFVRSSLWFLPLLSDVFSESDMVWRADVTRRGDVFESAMNRFGTESLFPSVAVEWTEATDDTDSRTGSDLIVALRSGFDTPLKEKDLGKVKALVTSNNITSLDELVPGFARFGDPFAWLDIFVEISSTHDNLVDLDSVVDSCDNPVPKMIDVFER